MLGQVVPGKQVWQATFAAGQMCPDSCLWFPTGRSRQFVIQTDVCCEPGMAGVPVLVRVVQAAARQQEWVSLMVQEGLAGGDEPQKKKTKKK